MPDPVTPSGESPQRETKRDVTLRDPNTGEPLSMERCPECGTIAAIWHKLGCPNDDPRSLGGAR